MKKLLGALAFLLWSAAAHAQSGCPNNNSPPLSGGGSVFGSIVSQWIQYFAQKIDVNNGFACNITLNGTISGNAFPFHVGKSVNNPGTGALENLLPVQTATGAGPIASISNGAYLQSKVLRSNATTAMTDTLPSTITTGMANGTQIDIVNVDTSASDTISAGSGTTINGNASYVLPAGSDIHLVYDLANTAWRVEGLPNPSATTLGGINSVTSLSHNWISYIDTSGGPHQAQPAFTDISGSVAATQMPALTGDVTTSAGAVATTLATVNSNIGTFNNATVTVNGKGLITAASGGSSGATIRGVPGNPTGATTAVMMGLGSSCYITPTYSTRIFIAIEGAALSSTTNAGGFVGLYYGSGSAPSNGATVTGSSAATAIPFISYSGAGAYLPFNISSIVTGLTVNTNYWFDASVVNLGGGTASIQNLTCLAYEF